MAAAARDPSSPRARACTCHAEQARQNLQTLFRSLPCLRCKPAATYCLKPFRAHSVKHSPTRRRSSTLRSALPSLSVCVRVQGTVLCPALPLCVSVRAPAEPSLSPGKRPLGVAPIAPNHPLCICMARLCTPGGGFTRGKFPRCVLKDRSQAVPPLADMWPEAPARPRLQVEAAPSVAP